MQATGRIISCLASCLTRLPSQKATVMPKGSGTGLRMCARHGGSRFTDSDSDRDTHHEKPLKTCMTWARNLCGVVFQGGRQGGRGGGNWTIRCCFFQRPRVRLVSNLCRTTGQVRSRQGHRWCFLLGASQNYHISLIE